MENKSHALIAGLFVLVFSLVAAMALWWMGRDNKSADIYILETRGNVTGLNVQATVRYRGIRAGKVDVIQPDPDDPRVIQVFISLDPRFKLTRGSTAQLGYQGVTGLAYVQIEDDGKRPEILPTDLEEPPRIAIKQTVFDTLGEKAGDIVGQLVDVSLRLSKVLDEKNAKNLTRTLENLAEASDGLRDGLRDLPELMTAMRQTLSPANLRSLQQILAHIEKTAGEAAPLAVEMRELVKSMSVLAQRMDKLAGEAGEGGEQVSANTLPRAHALLRETTTSARRLSHLIERLEETPQMLLLGDGKSPPGPGEAGFAERSK